MSVFVSMDWTIIIDTDIDLSTAATAEILYRVPDSAVELNLGGTVVDTTKISADISDVINNTVGKWIFRTHVISATGEIFFGTPIFVDVLQSWFPFDDFSNPPQVFPINTLSFNHNNLNNIDGNGTVHLSVAEKTELDDNTAARHARVHGISNTSDHTGLGGAVFHNLLGFDVNGLPEDSLLESDGTGNLTIPISKILTTEQISALNNTGLELFEDGKAKGIIINDDGDVLFNAGAQDYLFTSRSTTFAIQGQTPATSTTIELFSKDGTAVDDSKFIIYAKGTPAVATNTERMVYGYLAVNGRFEIFTDANAAGTLLPLAIYTEGNTNQHVLQTTGDNDFMDKVRITAEGGIAIKLTNRFGATLTKGQCVIADTTTDDSIDLSGANENQVIGIVYDATIADDAAGWVVVSGVADVAMEDNTAATHGNWVQASTAEAGYANAISAAPPGGGVGQLDLHMTEIGHCIETVAAGGGGTHILARCVLHFN